MPSVDTSPTEPESVSENDTPLRPRRSPEDLAKLVSYLTNHEKAEITYELVYFAAQAASDNDCAPLRGFLAELEDMAEVYTDPQRRRALQKTLREARKEAAASEAVA